MAKPSKRKHTKLTGGQVRASQQRAPLTPSPDEYCDAMVATDIEVGDGTDTIERAQKRLKATIDSDPLTVEDVHGKLFVGNRKALGQVEALSRMEIFEDQLRTIQDRLRNTEDRSDTLQQKVDDLEISVYDYKFLHHRFISTFKRDILNNATGNDHHYIATGNGFAHGGNCKRDVDLYEQPGGRRDFDAYVKLYGLHPSIVGSVICEFLS